MGGRGHDEREEGSLDIRGGAVSRNDRSSHLGGGQDTTSEKISTGTEGYAIQEGHIVASIRYEGEVPFARCYLFGCSFVRPSLDSCLTQDMLCVYGE